MGYSAFPVYCSVLFTPKRETRGALVNSPFSRWSKLSEILQDHESKAFHREAMQNASAFQVRMERPQASIPCLLEASRNTLVQHNRKILRSITKAVLFCGRQCIGLRGKQERISEAKNPGNLLALLSILAESDQHLSDHLDKWRKKQIDKKLSRVHYMSPLSQNEMITVLGIHIIQARIIKEIIQSKYFSIMADEVTSHNTEQMPLALRFVDAEKTIREEFIEFVNLKVTTGHAIATEILNTLEGAGLDVRNVRGQCYDGAAAMSSQRVGVQTRIREQSSNAVYVHCSAHCLNLVIVHSCALPNVRNTLDVMKQVCLFFNNSPKREGLLKCIIDKHAMDTTSRKPLLGLCKTRWAERHSAFQHFYQAYVYLVTAMEVIAHGLHQDDYDELFTRSQWDTNSKATACGLLKALTSFDMIISVLTIYVNLSRFHGVAVMLQGRTNDIVRAYSMVSEVKEKYNAMRANIEAEFDKIFKQALRLSQKLEVEPSLPRIAARQRHRSNAPAITPAEYYLRNLAIPLIDHIISELDGRFSALSTTVSNVLHIIPSVMLDSTITSQDMEPVVELYTQDLPSPELFETELLRWRVMVQRRYPDPKDDNNPIPDTVAKSLQICEESLFPNIFVLLKIFASIPATSSECERNASMLRRLSTHMRESVTEQRLTGLALMHVHYEMPVDLDEAVDIFAKLHPRRMQLSDTLS